MANKRSRDISDGAPGTPEIVDSFVDTAINESELDAEPVEPFDDGLPAAGYEQLREQRIKQNLQRMQTLGIVDLSLKLKSSISASSLKRAPFKLSSHRKTPLRSPLLFSEPPRRSSRLKNLTPVIYEWEEKLPKQVRKRRILPIGRRILALGFEVGPRPEIYTEEHVKLLGSTESNWELFVDGCGADGRRVYDGVNGKSCHQCRQKTLGHRTDCSNCQMIRGQYCGDCLYMRYGEHILEANENPNWVCPACRGICNCSLCRKANGWAPTGIMYRMISSMGYRSVAHYLIQTKLAPLGSDSEEKDQKTSHSAKRSLAFNDMSPQKKAVSEQKLDNGDEENIESKNKMDDGRGAIAFSEHKAGSIAGRTRSSCKKVKPDAVEIKIASSKKAGHKAKLSTSSHSSVQDSVARRLRPRISRP